MKNLLTALALTSLIMAGSANAFTHDTNVHQSDAVKVTICAGLFIQICVEFDIE